jgi:hypothetical protein
VLKLGLEIWERFFTNGSREVQRGGSAAVEKFRGEGVRSGTGGRLVVRQGRKRVMSEGRMSSTEEEKSGGGGGREGVQCGRSAHGEEGQWGRRVVLQLTSNRSHINQTPFLSLMLTEFCTLIFAS